MTDQELMRSVEAMNPAVACTVIVCLTVCLILFWREVLRK